jgi:tripartite-type tricarboxylate transporter receptor subunit TctC
MSWPAMSVSRDGHKHYKAKKVRVLTTFGDTRSDSYPEPPCLKEMGYPLTQATMYVIVGPKNIERSGRDRLADAFVKATQTPEWANLTKKLEVWSKSPMLYGDKLTEEVTRKNRTYTELLKKLGLLQQ